MSSEWHRTLQKKLQNQEQRLNIATLSLLLTTVLVAAYATYRWFGMDFRGYYAAAHLTLQGGNPYDYTQLAPTLFEIDGNLGNNPFYYAPWWALFFTPLAATLPYRLARIVWLGLNLVMFAVALLISEHILDWKIRKSSRWLIYWSAFLLLGWMCLRFEQSSIFLYLVLVLTLWALRQNQDWLAGLMLPLLLTKPNITILPVGILVCVFWFRGHRKALLWSGIGLGGLLLISTLVIPDWYNPILFGALPNGLTQVLDGPQQVVGVRINTTLLDWLKGFALPKPVAWGAWGLMVLISLGILTRQRNAETVYLVTLAAALGFVITPYALQYDYALLTLTLLWIYQTLPRLPVWQRWVGIGILAFLFSVLLWEQPISDGYWLALGLTALSAWFGWSSNNQGNPHRNQPGNLPLCPQKEA